MNTLNTATAVVLLQFVLAVEPQWSACTRVKDLPPCVCSINGKHIDLRSLANENTP